MNKNSNPFGMGLREWRKAQGLTQRQLSYLMADAGFNYDHTTISSYESGRTHPPGEFFAHLQCACKISTWQKCQVTEEEIASWLELVGLEYFTLKLRDYKRAIQSRPDCK